MITVIPAQEKDPRIAAREAEAAPLKARCKAAGVTHDAIAARAGCTRPFVVNVFAGRAKAPTKLVEAAEWLCDRAELRNAKKRTDRELMRTSSPRSNAPAARKRDEGVN